jgi:predicted HAD superfamily Cof-like phosphohydrolase
MLAEFHAAVSHPDTDVLWLRSTLHAEEHVELVEALASGNLHAIARELADVVYVAYGTAHAFGIDLDVALREVHRANMQKAHGPRRADGKALKPPGFVSPDMTEAVTRVGLDDAESERAWSYERAQTREHDLDA